MVNIDNKDHSKFNEILRNPYTWVLLVVLIFALFTRLNYQFADSIWNDEAVYMWNAYSLTKLDISNVDVTDALLPKFVSAFFSLFFSSFVAARLMSLLFVFIGIIFIYLLAKEVKNELAGIVAAILLTAHHLYWFIGAKGILDVPVTAMFVVTAYSFIKMEHTNNSFWRYATPVLVLLTMFTKRPGVLLIFIFVIYFAIVKNRIFFKDKNVLYALGVPVGIIAVGDLFYFLLFKSSFLVQLFNYLFVFRGINEFDYIKMFFTFMMNGWVILFLVIGIILAVFYKNKDCLFMGLWAVFIVGFFDFNLIGDTLPRYLLPAIPAVFVIASFGMAEINDFIRMFTKKNLAWLIIIVAVLISYPMYQQGVALHESKIGTYSGYPEAADYVLRNAEDNAVLYAGSPRTMRALTKWNFYEDPNGDFIGGRLYFLRSDKYKTDRAVFENEVKALVEKGVPIYLEIDMWEYTQPSWYFPLSQQSLNDFINDGFEVKYFVEKDVQTQQGPQKAPVIFVLKHSGRLPFVEAVNVTDNNRIGSNSNNSGIDDQEEITSADEQVSV